MKKLIPLALALLLLPACGEDAPSAAALPAPAAELITPGPASAPVAAAPPEEAAGRALPDTMALPDTPFEPESYWLAGPFGDGGQALLLMSADGRFKCWYNYIF